MDLHLQVRKLLVTTCTTYTTDFFCGLYLVPLFGLPVYYVSQASACLPDSAYQSSTESQTYESNPTQVAASTVVALSLPPRESLLKLEQAWNSYLDSRLAEWKAIFTLACVFIA
jgi:hypothetical protein